MLLLDLSSRSGAFFLKFRFRRTLALLTFSVKVTLSLLEFFFLGRQLRFEPLELDSDSTSFRAASAVKSSYSKRASQLAAIAVFAFMIAGTFVLRFVH